MTRPASAAAHSETATSPLETNLAPPVHGKLGGARRAWNPAAQFVKETFAHMARLPEGHSAVGSDLAQIERLAQILGGIPVWAVARGSSAQRAGVCFGDIILSVNGVPTPTYKDFLKAGRAHLLDLEFKVFRNGKVIVLRYQEPVEA